MHGCISCMIIFTETCSQFIYLVLRQFRYPLAEMFASPGVGAGGTGDDDAAADEDHTQPIGSRRLLLAIAWLIDHGYSPLFSLLFSLVLSPCFVLVDITSSCLVCQLCVSVYMSVGVSVYVCMSQRCLRYMDQNPTKSNQFKSIFTTISSKYHVPPFPAHCFILRSPLSFLSPQP